jgi:antitoxin HicB
VLQCRINRCDTIAGEFATRTMMTREYDFTVILEPEPEGGFTVRVPMLPEVVSFGESEEAALEMARDAIQLAVEHRRERDEPVPVEGRHQIHHVRVALPA